MHRRTETEPHMHGRLGRSRRTQRVRTVSPGLPRLHRGQGDLTLAKEVREGDAGHGMSERRRMEAWQERRPPARPPGCRGASRDAVIPLGGPPLSAGLEHTPLTLLGVQSTVGSGLGTTM